MARRRDSVTVIPPREVSVVRRLADFPSMPMQLVADFLPVALLSVFNLSSSIPIVQSILEVLLLICSDKYGDQLLLLFVIWQDVVSMV
jgi:hypothetical protein